MPPLTILDPDALPGPASLRDARRRARERFDAGPLPTEADEIWRYSRIDEFDPARFRPAAGSAPADVPAEVEAVIDRIGPRSALVVTINGVAVRVEGAHPGLAVEPAARIGDLTSGMAPWDAWAELNTAQAPTPVRIAAAAGAVVDDPVVVCHWAAGDETVTFPRTVITAAEGAQLRVVEYHLSGDVDAWVDAVVEVDVADGAHVGHIAVQELGPRVWQTAYGAFRVGRDAVLRSFTVSLGGEYARVRTDSRVAGAGGEAYLSALYCGNDHQMHDFRTLQDHAGPKSTSDLVFKGAVVDEARSAYSGLIRVRRGAAGTKAFQTNRNLILSDTGLATYSVPNLDIEENDVSCSHASATGPIDPEQRFYLESRGVPTEDADRLIVLGFFDDLLAGLPVPALREHLGGVIGAKLGVTGALG